MWFSCREESDGDKEAADPAAEFGSVLIKDGEENGVLTPDGPELVKEELGVVGSEFGCALANDVENGVLAPDKSELAIAPGLAKG